MASRRRFRFPPFPLAGLLLLAFALFPIAPAWAAIEVAFYSREWGSNFPHAFVTLNGTLDRNGEPIEASYGFTATAISPAILMGSVAGEVVTEKPDMVAKSDRQFAVILDDAGYDRLMAVVAEWRDRAQPSYNLNRRNCVHFVGELAQAAGLTVAFEQKLMKRPRSFLLAVKADNETLLNRQTVIAAQ